MKDPYVYEGTRILKNKLDIREEKELDRTETEFVGLAIENMKSEGFEINSIFDFLNIHYNLFNSLYEWAGQPRTINIFKGEEILNYKSIDYVYASYIQTALEELDNEFIKVDWSILTPQEKTNKISYFISEFWHIHPFREGNTRTTAVGLYFLIKKTNMHINDEFLNKNSKFFRNALVLSCLYSGTKENYLKEIIEYCVTFKDSLDSKYKTIDGYEVEKYAYKLHTVKKIKTIKKPKDWMK